MTEMTMTIVGFNTDPEIVDVLIDRVVDAGFTSVSAVQNTKYGDTDLTIEVEQPESVGPAIAAAWSAACALGYVDEVVINVWGDCG